MEQFKVIIYYNDYNFNRKINGKVVTDIKTLLRILNNRDYYKCINDKFEHVPTGSDFDYIIKNSFEGYTNRIHHFVIEKYPTDTSIRIISISTFYDLQKYTDTVLFEDICDSEINSISEQYMNYYPYTMKEFLDILANNIYDLSYNEYDYIALKHI